MYRVATTLLMAATVFLHTVIGCGICRSCERDIPASQSIATPHANSECGDCNADGHDECDSHPSPAVVASAIASFDASAVDLPHCECGGDGGKPLSHPCGHGTCSLRVTKFLNITNSAIPDTAVTWLTVDDLQKPAIEELRSYPTRRLRHRPQQLRSHLSLQVLLI